MSDVFISYSRKNLTFAEELFEELKQQNITAWVDWKEIPSGAGWWDEITRGINAASTFVFLMSNDSLSSAVCALELAHAIENGKRIIPVRIEDPDFNTSISVRPANELFQKMLRERDLFKLVGIGRENLQEHNWIFFRTDAQGNNIPFETSVKELIDTVKTDLELERQRARLLVRMKDWKDSEQVDDFLLIGSEIDDAENWLETVQSTEISEYDESLPKLKTYIKLSRERNDELKRQRQEYIDARKESEQQAEFARKEREKAEQQAKNAKRASKRSERLALIAGVATLIAVIVGIITGISANNSQAQAKNASIK